MTGKRTYSGDEILSAFDMREKVRETAHNGEPWTPEELDAAEAGALAQLHLGLDPALIGACGIIVGLVAEVRRLKAADDG